MLLLPCCRRYHMYWTDDTYNRIYRADLDGSNSRILLSTGLSCPGQNDT